ncbi:MAG: hypothetical protein QMC96_12270 [Methanomicrobiales archaeon]|nr:hypothetical protein [Methanomicrobiales archaeon]
MAARKAGYAGTDPSTGRALYHIHSLRKFFRTRLGRYDEVEMLMGHEGGYLSSAYVRLTEDDLARFYRANQHRLYIERPVVLEDAAAQEQLERQEQQIQEMQARFDEMFARLQASNAEQIAALRQEMRKR